MAHNIVVLDGYTLNPGDLLWDGFEELGELHLHNRTKTELIVSRAIDADCVLTNKVPLTKETIDRLPNLRYIGVLATGFNIVDTEYAKNKGIVVTNVPGYSSASVAQSVFAHILELTNLVGLHSKVTHEGKWANSEDFCFFEAPTKEIDGLCLGIVGLGDIGTMVAKIALSFGMKVIATKRTPLKEPIEGIKMTTLDNLYAKADIVSLNCPQTKETQEMINKDSLKKFKPSAFLINTSRGGLINEADLAEALNNGTIAGAGLDVLAKEPATKNNPLVGAKNCNITPHIAWATPAARLRLMKTATQNLKDFLNGSPVNQVN